MSETETKNLEAAPLKEEQPSANGRSTLAAKARDSLEAQRIAEKTGALVMQARREQRAGKKSAAMKTLQAALALNSTDGGALELLGDLFLEDAEQEKALKVFEHGLKHHPNHRAFEEKAALCILDLKEMERHQEKTKQVLEYGLSSEGWADLAPNRAFGLSFLMPGAGHFYAEENERAAWILGSYVFCSLGWILPLYFGIGNAGSGGAKGLDRVSYAVSNMGLLGLWFWIMVVACIAIYGYALFDSLAAVERTNDKRKHGFGDFDF